MSYPTMLKSSSSKDDVSSENLERLLTQVLNDVSLIYPTEIKEITAEVIVEVSETIRSYFDEIQQNLSAQAKDPGLLLMAEKLLLSDEEPFLHSEKLNVTGIPYRLVEIGGSFVPVVIKTGKAPENGVWVNDRLHLTSFVMLAEDMYDGISKSGFVLYARSGLYRNVNIHANDRRQVLKAIVRVRKIKEGSMPDKKESSLCGDCSYSEMCNVKSSLASKFF